MTTTVIPWLLPYVDAALEGGFDVTVPSVETIHATYVFVTKTGQPGCVIMERPEFPELGQSPRLLIPVRPSREHGSAVLLDFEGEPDELPAVLEKPIASPTVLTRFVDVPTVVAVDARVPASGTRLTYEYGTDQNVSCDECDEVATQFWPKLAEPVQLCDSCPHDAVRSGWQPGA